MKKSLNKKSVNVPTAYELWDEESNKSVYSVIKAHIHILKYFNEIPYIDDKNCPHLVLTRIRKECTTNAHEMMAMIGSKLLVCVDESYAMPNATTPGRSKMYQLLSTDDFLSNFRNHLTNFYSYYNTWGNVEDYLHTLDNTFDTNCTVDDIIEKAKNIILRQSGQITPEELMEEMRKAVGEEWIANVVPQYVQEFRDNDFSITIKSADLTKDRIKFLQSVFCGIMKEESTLYSLYEDTRAHLNMILEAKNTDYLISTSPYIKVTSTKKHTTFRMSGRQCNKYCDYNVSFREAIFKGKGIGCHWDVHSSIPALLKAVNTGIYEIDEDIKTTLLEKSGVDMTKAELKQDGIIFRFAFDNGHYGHYLKERTETKVSKEDWEKLRTAWNDEVGENNFKNSNTLFLLESIIQMGTVIDIYEKEHCSFVGNVYDCFYTPYYVDADRIKGYYLDNVVKYLGYEFVSKL